MADQQSSHAAISAAVNTYYEKDILESFEPTVVFYSHAPIKAEIPKGGGSVIEFTRYKKIAPKVSDNTDEFTASQTYLSAEVITATIRERDEYVQISRFADLTAIGGVLDQAMKKIKMTAARGLDKLVRNDIGMAVADVANTSSVNMDNLAIDGGTLNSSGIGAKVFSHTSRGEGFPMYHNKLRLAQSADVTSFASSSMTVKTLLHGVSVLEGKDIPSTESGTYKFICHTDVAYQLSTTPGFKGWVSPTSSESLKTSPSVIGIIGKTEIVTSTHAFKFPLSGDTLSTSSGNLYCSLLFGDEAFGVTELGDKGFKLYMKESGPQTTSDPTNMKKQVGYSIRAVAKVLNKSAGLWILTTGV
jgi:N4-gp56 family major capsid protein